MFANPRFGLRPASEYDAPALVELGSVPALTRSGLVPTPSAIIGIHHHGQPRRRRPGHHHITASS